MLNVKNLLKFSAKRTNFLIWFGLLALFVSVFIFSFTFLPVFKVELNYLVNVETKELNQNRGNAINPVDEDFGIVIPKINANSKVVENVDPYNENEYQWALTKGLAHAKGTSLPGEKGNIFIFSHSAVNFYQAEMYNAVFYLLSKMEKGDEIYIFYRSEKFKYVVTGKATVDPGDLFYLTQKTDKNILTLMTCWPPGTSLQRLIVTAEMVY